EYLIDQYGRIRDEKFGEGGYADTETQIRSLLAEAGHAPKAAPGESGAAGGASSLVSPELYASGDRAALADQESARNGDIRFFDRPSVVQRDLITLVDNWTLADEKAVAGPDPASALVDFHAASANAVLDGPAGACVRVLLDGADVQPGLRGKDVQDVGGVP